MTFPPEEPEMEISKFGSSADVVSFSMAIPVLKLNRSLPSYQKYKLSYIYIRSTVEKRSCIIGKNINRPRHVTCGTPEWIIRYV